MIQSLLTTNNLAVTVEEIKAKITDFEGRFKALKRSTRGGLDRRHIGVKRVIECLTELRADDMPDHKVFLEDNIHTLFKSEDNTELFESPLGLVSRASRIFPRVRMRVRKWAGEGKEVYFLPFPRPLSHAHAHTGKNTAGSRDYTGTTSRSTCWIISSMSSK